MRQLLLGLFLGVCVFTGRVVRYARNHIDTIPVGPVVPTQAVAPRARAALRMYATQHGATGAQRGWC